MTTETRPHRPTFITYEEARAKFKISRDTLYRAVNRGEIQRYGTERCARFDVDELVRWFTNPPKRPKPGERTNRQVLVGANTHW